MNVPVGEVQFTLIIFVTPLPLSDRTAANDGHSRVAKVVATQVRCCTTLTWDMEGATTLRSAGIFLSEPRSMRGSPEVACCCVRVGVWVVGAATARRPTRRKPSTSSLLKLSEISNVRW